MKTTKTIFRSKVIMLAALSVLLLVSTAFITKRKAAPVYDKSYFYIVADPNSASDFGKNKNRYFTSILSFEGPEICKMPGYEFEDKAKAAFSAYLKAEYADCKYIGLIITYNRPSSSDRNNTMQKAQEKMNNTISKEKSDGHEVVKTSFTYNCE